MNTVIKPIGIFYEHPEWFIPLFKELDKRGIAYNKIAADQHSFDPQTEESPFSLVINRMSSSAHLREHGNAYFHTSHYLYHLESLGVPVINGSFAQQIESSKAKQLSIFKSLGLKGPKTIAVNHISQIENVAASLNFPILLKGNIGGSGTGITQFNTAEELKFYLQNQEVDFGMDHTLLVQEYLTAKNQHIVRVETLNGKFLYAIKVFPNGTGFNLCPADLCLTPEVPEKQEFEACLTEVEEKGIKVEGYTPPQSIIDAVEAIAQKAGLDVGGVEYLINEKDDEPYFYDINAMSNFVANAPTVVGFNPYVNFVDYIEARLKTALKSAPLLINS